MKYSESNEDLLNEYAQLSGKLMQRYLSEEEQTQLREMRGELLRRMTAAAETTPPAKPAYEEIVTGLERDIEHLARWSRS